jgi:hypothetical protein
MDPQSGHIHLRRTLLLVSEGEAVDRPETTIEASASMLLNIIFQGGQ